MNVNVRSMSVAALRDEVLELRATKAALVEAARHAAMEWRLHGQLTDSCRVLEAAIEKAVS